MGDEARAVSAAIAHPGVFLVHLFLAAWCGREAETLELIAANDRDAAARGEGWAITAGRYTSVVLYNGLGRYALALTAAQQADEGSEDLGRSSWVLPELVEAASRGGRPELAADALRRLSEDARASGTDWALGIEARSRALLSADDHADKLYREAIERLARTRIRSELARAHLLYGEWLRRENRRVDAREQLRTAHEMLTAIGAEAFAERAAIELQATGETARKRTVSTLDELTPQEARIARLARDGAVQPGHRLAAVHQPQDGRVPPAQGVRQAPHQLPHRPRGRARWPAAYSTASRLRTGSRSAAAALASRASAWALGLPGSAW